MMAYTYESKSYAKVATEPVRRKQVEAEQESSEQKLESSEEPDLKLMKNQISKLALLSDYTGGYRDVLRVLEGELPVKLSGGFIQK